MKKKLIEMVVLWEDGTWNCHMVRVDAMTPEFWLESKGQQVISEDPYYRKAVISYLWNPDPEVTEEPV